MTVAPAEVPVALLPVGVETRFRDDALLVRVIPDEIHVSDHEPDLTASEVGAGRAFWRAVWRGGTAEPAATDAERAAWTGLVRAVGNPRRGAWVADRTAPPDAGRPADPVPADQPLPEPPFPDPEQQDGPWTRAAVAGSMPDTFVAIAYRRDGSGGAATWTEIGRGTGQPVARPLQLGPDPSAPPPAVTDDGPALPDGLQWLVEPTAADAAGLLVRVPLPPGTTAVDRLVVLGVAGSLAPKEAGERLGDLLTGHHFTRGLELLPIATTTNNTAAGRSGWARRDDPVASFDTERRTPEPPDGTDGALLARALGVPASTLAGVAGAGAAEQAAAGQLVALVWPASFGYWLESLVQPGPDDAAIHDLRDHAVATVRGRGPLPPLRVGRQPYGVLPVTSLRAWRAATESPTLARVAGLLRSALPWWLDGVAHAPVVRAGQDPDHGLLDLLGQAAVSTQVGVRSLVGANASFVARQITDDPLAGNLAAEASRQRWLSLVTLGALGLRGLPYLGELVARPDPVPLLHLPYADDAAAAFLRGLRGRTTPDLRAEDPRSFTSLLALLAHRSVLLERVRAGLLDTRGVIAGQLVEAHLRVANSPAVDAGLVSTTATLRIGETRSSVGAVLAGSVERPGAATMTLPDYLDDVLVRPAQLDVAYRDYAATVTAAEAAAALPSDRAALLLGEALDTASHRVDAWVTSLATRRLADLRATMPTGVTLGAYGVVEELHRDPAGVPDSSGYVHAPSLAQAATAAVLRSGHLSHAATDPASAALAVDLSSARVRAALALLDGVRQGQPLGALLGYLVERRLHELGAHTAVAAVRLLAPPPVVTEPGDPEGVPPRSVCDGLALSRLDRATVLAATTAAAVDATAVGAALDALAASVDGLADLLLAEGVHQIVVGNPERAAAALDALNRGDGGLPEPAVVRTPRTGTTLTHRVLVALGPDTPKAPGWPVDGVRAVADPRLAAWAGHLLGDPTGVDVVVTWTADGASTPTVTRITLADLGVGALDLVYEPLLARVLRHARARGAAAGAAVDLDSGPIGPLLVTADLVHALLMRVRAGGATDLARGQDGAEAPDVDAGDRAARLAAARARLAAAVEALRTADPAAPDETALMPHLDLLGSLGHQPGGVPDEPLTGAALAALLLTAQRTLDAATAAPEDPAALFGEGFPVTARVVPPTGVDLAAGLAVDPLAAAAPAALETWLETHGRVRGPVGRLADVLLAARLRATDAGTLRVAQLPAQPFPHATDPADRTAWVGAAFPARLGGEPVTSLVLQSLGTVDPAAGVSLLVVDEFVETVPSRDTTTGLSFGFDAPGARPPQSVLLAVPPVLGQAWTLDALAEVVGETVDLAKVRMVDLSSVAWAGRFLPTLHLTEGDLASGLDLPMRAVLQAAALRASEVLNP